MNPQKLMERAALLLAAVAAASAAGVFLSIALYVALLNVVHPAWAALLVAGVLCIAALALLARARYRTHQSRERDAPPAPPSVAGALSDPLGAAQDLFRTRPIAVLVLCAGAGFLAARHPGLTLAAASAAVRAFNPKP